MCVCVRARWLAVACGQPSAGAAQTWWRSWLASGGRSLASYTVASPATEDALPAYLRRPTTPTWLPSARQPAVPAPAARPLVPPPAAVLVAAAVSVVAVTPAAADVAGSTAEAAVSTSRCAPRARRKTGQYCTPSSKARAHSAASRSSAASSLKGPPMNSVTVSSPQSSRASGASVLSRRHHRKARRAVGSGSARGSGPAGGRAAMVPLVGSGLHAPPFGGAATVNGTGAERHGRVRPWKR